MNLTADTHSILRDVRYHAPGVPSDDAIRNALVEEGQRICDQVTLAGLILDAKKAEFERNIPNPAFPAIAVTEYIGAAEYIGADQRVYADSLVRLGVIVDILTAASK